jgi:putative phage-type endonuclease
MELPKKEWLEKRKKGIGGSDVAAICGVSPYKTPFQVWEEKRSEYTQDIDNDAMFWGRTLEPVIRQRYSDLTGRIVMVPEQILVHPKHNFIIGNIDGFTDDPRGVEIKTAGYPTGWGEPGTDEIPIGYIFQVQHYMMITGFPVFDVPVLIGGRDFRLYEVQEDHDLQNMILCKERSFWEMVQTGTPPPPVTYEDVVRYFRQSEAKAIMATTEIEELIQGIIKIRGTKDLLDKNETELKRRVMEFMAEADTLIDLKGNALATWKTGKPIAGYYVKEKEAQRKFLIKNQKEEK